MKKIGFAEWLIKEASNFANLETRSIKKIAIANNARANNYLAYYFYFTNKYSGLNNKAVIKVAKVALNIEHDQKGLNDYLKTFTSWESVINWNTQKKEIINRVNNVKDLKSACKKLNYNYANSYRFFVKNTLSALTIIKAQNIALELMKISKNEVDRKY